VPNRTPQRLTFAALLITIATVEAIPVANAATETPCRYALSKSESPGGNCLGGASSPYLRLHAKDPVNWRPWGDRALAEARATGRLVFLSIGYTACHWCHVMQRDNFEDPVTARMMNENFINILVDREEHPDIDQTYLRAAAAMNMPTGWPLNVFLTPDGAPIFAGTYYPPERRQGMPAFREVLSAIAETHRENPASIVRRSAYIALDLTEAMTATPGKLSRASLVTAAESLLREIDPFHGGFGESAKFHSSWALRVLWRAYLRSGDDRFRDAVTLSLDNMTRGGFYDHIGGGFSRYTEDPAWNVPHFEKVLDVNAQLLEIMVEVWRETRSPHLRTRIRETVAFLLREMRQPHGAFASAIDSDSEGREGAYYVWSAAEIDSIVGVDAKLFKRAYGVTPDGNWKDGANILSRSGDSLTELAADSDLKAETIAAKLALVRDKLKKIRNKRSRPVTDDKLLGDWNGLAIVALTEAGKALDEPNWLAAAEAAYATVRRALTRDGRLHHSWRAGKVGPEALLDDYAQLARTGLALFEATGKPEYLSDARRWIAETDRFGDAGGAGYFQSATPSSGMMPRLKVGYDEQMPSANAILAGTMARLYYLVGEDRYRTAAERTLESFFGTAVEAPLAHGAILTAADSLIGAIQVVIVGHRDGRKTERLLDEVWRASLPGRVLQVIAPDTALPDGHPASGKGQIDGLATAYVCIGTFCSLPVTSADSLSRALREIRQRAAFPGAAATNPRNN